MTKALDWTREVCPTKLLAAAASTRQNQLSSNEWRYAQRLASMSTHTELYLLHSRDKAPLRVTSKIQTHPKTTFHILKHLLEHFKFIFCSFQINDRKITKLMLNENFDPSHLRGENVASKLFIFHLIMYLCMLNMFISFKIDGVAEISIECHQTHTPHPSFQITISQ